MQILNNFFHLSGLKISVSKTKAIWFGVGYNSAQKLCPDLNLDWDTEFCLLGIVFDGNLANMERNLDAKIAEIKKLLNCWIHRSLTIYGKIVVVKTLALSKLSHVALVIPCITPNKIREIESLFFKFIWNNKPDKGMIDIKDFWQAFRFSWFRRLNNTNAYWPNILLDTVNEITGEIIDINTLLEMGPTKIQSIGKKINNKFWKEVFGTVVSIIQGAIFCHPEKILLTSFWNNPLVTKNRPIKESDFPNISQHFKYFQDFFEVGTKDLVSKAAIEEKCNIQLSLETYIELKYIIKTSLQKIGLRQDNLPLVQLPIQPILINIATLVNKGCNIYYKLIRRKKVLNCSIQDREAVWHQELQTTFGIQFWDKTYSLTVEIKNDNRMKWLQYQIVRNSLFTNHKVNKFNRNISPLCRNCFSVEKIGHMMKDCGQAEELWNEIKAFFNNFLENPLEFTVRNILFGYHNESMNSIVNFVILVAKAYIWKSKFEHTPLQILLFKKYLKAKLEDLKFSFEFMDKSELFEQWVDIFASL